MTRARLLFLAAPPQYDPAGRRTFAIGKFDGLHRGHERVVKLALKRSRESGSTACLFAFTPHPRVALIGDGEYARWLTPAGERAVVAGEFGIGETYVALFDAAFRRQTAERFVCDYLLPLGACHLIVGYDFRFGQGGAYGTEDLGAIAEREGIGLDVAGPVDVGGTPVSSSRIRAHLRKGELAAATALLGRPYRLRGRVVHGDARGRALGFPTANLALVEPFVIPATGVYAVRARVDGRELSGAMNIGSRPTVSGEGRLSIEVHLLDFAGDLYDRELAVDLVSYLRPEIRFPSRDDLTRQLALDVMAARDAVGRGTAFCAP